VRRYTQVMQDEDDVLVSGNVTRYNMLSGYGRLYDDNLGQTIAFEVVPTLSRQKRVLLTESLADSQRSNTGKLMFKVMISRDSRGDERKYTVKDVIEPNDKHGTF
jgi:hypothetical protein